MTINMESLEKDDVQLTEQNFRHICRLCLRADEEIVNIFRRPTTESRPPLVDRVNELYHLKVFNLFFIIISIRLKMLKMTFNF